MFVNVVAAVYSDLPAAQLFLRFVMAGFFVFAFYMQYIVKRRRILPPLLVLQRSLQV
jgi:hypothetical protein